MKKTKTVIISLDGVPVGLIKDFAETAVMPNTAKLISQGTLKKMHSTIPEISSVAWASVITGENPGVHGVYGFTDLFPGTYKMRFPNFNDVKAPPFWEQWNTQSAIINVPFTYPAREMKGVHISGFVAPNFEKAVYPKSLIPKLNSLDYRVDVDSQKAHSSMDMFLSDLDKTLEARIKAYRHLWDNCNWQIFMLVFTGTDRLMHFLWQAYEDKDHKYHDSFLEHFRKVDEAIGQISSQLTENDLIILHSDHGFEKLDKEVYINYLLIQEKLLHFKPDADISLKNMSEDTKAFTLDPARIYLNLKGKFPAGSVEQTESEDILRQLENLFGSLEIDGRKVIRDIYRKEQLFHGPYLEQAPDMVLVGAEGFNLRANVKAKSLTGKAIFTGKHTQDTAFLLIKGLSDNSIIPDIPTVADIKGIIEKSSAFS